MTPRDLSQSRALIACNSPIEIIDLTEFLQLHGWGEPIVLDDAKAACDMVASADDPVQMVVLALPESDPHFQDLVQICLQKDCPLIIINGVHNLTQDRKVAEIRRPFTDADLEAAMAQLGTVVH